MTSRNLYYSALARIFSASCTRSFSFFLLFLMSSFCVLSLSCHTASLSALARPYRLIPIPLADRLLFSSARANRFLIAVPVSLSSTVYLVAIRIYFSPPASRVTAFSLPSFFHYLLLCHLLSRGVPPFPHFFFLTVLAVSSMYELLGKAGTFGSIFQNHGTAIFKSKRKPLSRGGGQKETRCRAEG